MHYRALFLSMSCDLPLYRAQSMVVERTWAKAIINGKRPEYAFYTFTECDLEHQTQCIDGNTIYIDTPAGLYNTYEKNRQALVELHKAGITFDFLVRTNTATYININNFDKLLETLPTDKMTGNLCPQAHRNEDGTYTHVFNIVGGNFMVLPAWIADEVRETEITPDNISEYYVDGSVTPVDDFLIAAVLIHNHPEQRDNINVVPLARYKTLVSNDIQKPPFNSYDLVNVYNTIEEVSDKVFVQLKMPNCHPLLRYIEIEHMIELYDALG